MRGNTTLFVFALEQGNGPASLERLALVTALLEAGAYVNEREFAGEYPWRRWVRRDAEGREQVEMLKLFIAHGAMLNLRTGGPSAVAEAVGQESWETALVLLEAGAPWMETGLRARAAAALAKYAEGEAPEALRKVVARLD